MKKKILTLLLAILLCAFAFLGGFVGSYVAIIKNNSISTDYTKKGNVEFELAGTPTFLVKQYSDISYNVRFSITVRCLTPNYRYRYVFVTIDFYSAESNVIYETSMDLSYNSSLGLFGETTIEFNLSEKPTFYKIKNIEGFNEN